MDLLRESGHPSSRGGASPRQPFSLDRRELEPLVPVPSPWGEGTGEGKGFVQKVNVLLLFKMGDLLNAFCVIA